MQGKAEGERLEKERSSGERVGIDREASKVGTVHLRTIFPAHLQARASAATLMMSSALGNMLRMGHSTWTAGRRMEARGTVSRLASTLVSRRSTGAQTGWDKPGRCYFLGLKLTNAQQTQTD